MRTILFLNSRFKLYPQWNMTSENIFGANQMRLHCWGDKALVNNVACRNGQAKNETLFQVLYILCLATLLSIHTHSHIQHTLSGLAEWQRLLLHCSQPDGWYRSNPLLFSLSQPEEKEKAFMLEISLQGFRCVTYGT